MQHSAIQKLFRSKPYLAWYIKDTKKLSEVSLVEHILNYGQWDDYLIAEKELGVEKLKLIFSELKSQKRPNLHPRTINYFENYFQKYA